MSKLKEKIKKFAKDLESSYVDLYDKSVKGWEILRNTLKKEKEKVK